MTALELAQKYYPTLWSIERLQALVAADKLTAAEYETLTGQAYE